jgi:hypothetical protein
LKNSTHILGKPSHLCQCRWPKRDCLDCPPKTEEQIIVEKLFAKSIIDEENNGWVRRDSNWYPLSYFIKLIKEGH